ncbi:MAG: TetR/AcrR family transcriptional regulator [Sphingobium sp.]
MTSSRHPDGAPTTDQRHERRTGRPSLEQAERIHQRLLETATAIYLREGPAVTMKAIVHATGLSSKTVYARYPNKDALFLAVLRFLLRKAQPPMDLDVVRDCDIRGTLQQFVMRSMESAFTAESVAMHRLLSADRRFTSQLGPELFEAVDRMFTDPLTTYLDRMRIAGRIRSIDSQQTARAITTLIIAEPAARHSHGRAPPSQMEMAQRAAFIADLFCHGLERRT